MVFKFVQRLIFVEVSYILGLLVKHGNAAIFLWIKLKKIYRYSSIDGSIYVVTVLNLFTHLSRLLPILFQESTLCCVHCASTLFYLNQKSLKNVSTIASFSPSSTMVRGLAKICFSEMIISKYSSLDTYAYTECFRIRVTSPSDTYTHIIFHRNS